jgi:proline-specific peptidase
MKFHKSLIILLPLAASLILWSCQSQKPVPKEGFVDVTGGKVWYHIVGDGPGTPLLVLHGGPGIPSYYLKPLAGLGQYRPVVFYDQLGCGHSPVPDDTTLWRMDRFVEAVGRLRRALGLKEIDIYGHSWGSMLAAEYLLTKPEGVRACIMAGPALSIPRWIHDADSLLTTLPDSVQQVIRRNEAAGTTDSPEYQTAMMDFYGRYLARKQPWSADIDSSFAQMNQAMYGYMEGPSEFTITGTIRNYDVTGRLSEIDVPTLFIVGQYDEAPPATAAYYRSLMPNAGLAVIPEAAHLAMQDDSAKYVETVEAFLERTDKK